MRLWRALVTGLVVLTGSLLWVRVAGAHALLVRSSPEANAELAQAPPTIEMWFSEPLETQFSGARLINASGAEVPVGAALVDPFDRTHMTLPLTPLEPGIYTVAWQTLSAADGHEWYGSFPFTVLNPDGSRPTGIAASATGATRGELPPPAEVIARWLVLLGGVLMFGPPLFQQLVVPSNPAPDSVRSAGLANLSRDVVLNAMWISVLAITVGHVLQVASQSLRLGGLYQSPSLLLGTRIGNLVLARQVLALAGLLAVLILDQPPPLRGRERQAFFLTAGCAAVALLLLGVAAWRGDPTVAIATFLIAAPGVAWAAWAPRQAAQAEHRVWGAVLLLGGALLLTFSLGSHAGAGAGSVWAVMGDYVHLVAASVWVGGLTMLPVLVWRARKTTLPADESGFLPLVRRFSHLASFSVFVLVLTGLFNSLVELPDVASLFSTAYGRVLLVKLFLMALALQLAFLNNRLVHRRGQRLNQTAGLRQFGRQVAQESLVSVGLMLSVAILVQTQTPRAPSAGFPAALPFSAINRADDLSIHIQVTPNQAGNNRFWTHLYHEDGSPIGEVQLVRLLFNYRDAQLGQAQTDLEPLGQDTFGLEGAYLNQAGTWDLSVYVRRRGLDDSLTEFAVEVRPASGEVAVPTNPWQNPIAALPPLYVLGGLLAAAGLIPILWRQPLQAAQARLWPTLAWLGGGLIALGAGLVLWAFIG